MSQGYTKGIPISTDPTMSLGSNLVVPSQAAVIAYVNSLINSGSVNSVNAAAPVVSSGGINPTISMPQASATQDGYLSAADYAAFSTGGGGVTKGFVIAMAAAL